MFKFNKYTLIFVATLNMNSQTVNIPDPIFEGILVYQGIDSDQQINGQILSSDAFSVEELDLYYDVPDIDPIYSLQGIEEFTNIHTLTVVLAQIPDQSINFNAFNNLVNLYFLSNGFSNIDVSQNSELESIWVGNLYEDLGPFNIIESLDLSNNPNINEINAWGLSSLNTINLRNNNNEYVSVFLGNPHNYPYNVCIEVDDVNSALENLAPYNTWEITGNYFFSEKCSLSVESFVKNNYKIYPNPSSDYIFIEEQMNIDNKIHSVQILDINGKLIKNINNGLEKIFVGDIISGNYLLIINTSKGNLVEKIVIK